MGEGEKWEVRSVKCEVVGRGEKPFARCVGARHASPVIAAGG